MAGIVFDSLVAGSHSIDELRIRNEQGAGKLTYRAVFISMQQQDISNNDDIIIIMSYNEHYQHR